MSDMFFLGIIIETFIGIAIMFFLILISKHEKLELRLKKINERLIELEAKE